MSKRSAPLLIADILDSGQKFFHTLLALPSNSLLTTTKQLMQ